MSNLRWKEPRVEQFARLETLEFDAVLFDLDGTLIDSSDAIRRSWKTMARAHGLAPDFEFTSHGVPARDVIASLLAPERVDDALTLVQELEEIDTAGIVPLSGAAELLRSLDGRRGAIVTSCTARLASARIAAAGLPTPPVLITADDVIEGKPSPLPYLLAAERLGSRPDHSIAFEDAPAGLASARAAGCWTIAVESTHQADRLVADGIIRALSDVAVETHSRLSLKLDLSRS